jgi:iron complex outermembrane recepter protein
MKLMREVSGGGRLGSKTASCHFHPTASLLLALFCLAVSSVCLSGNLDRIVLFDIKAQTLENALLEFGVQAHVQIVFPSKSTIGRTRTTALRGRYTARQALTNLLKGSPFEFVESGNEAEIVPIAWTPSEVRRTDDKRADSDQKKIVPAQGRADPITTPGLQKNNPPTARTASALREVTVTGTHIHGAPLSAPLIRITQEDIDRSGYASVGDVIRSLPDNFGNTGPQTAIGSAPNANPSLSGAPSPNLYGLGAGSTLTLLDGQRLAVDAASGSVDISLIPLPVIDHIDVLTGGASAVYGSDAVAGVVNIVLKRNFNGVKTTLLGGGTADGGGTERYANQMLGKTWGSGGALFDFESDEQDPILASERDYTDSATPLTTTLPGASRSSIFVSAHQDIGTVSAFITGLYTHRAERYALQYSPEYPGQDSEAAVRQFAADGGLTASLPSEWSLSVVGDLSEDRTVVASTVLQTPPTLAPLVGEEGQLRSWEGTANGPILTIPSGAIRSAIGIGSRVETYNDEQGGVTDTPGARRTVKYAYGELDSPLLKSSQMAWRQALMLDVSGRFEHYSDFGDESIPKIGLVYVPFSTVKIRAAWGKAFRAPPLFDVYNSTEVLYFPLPDNLSSTGVSDALVAHGGNTELKPETARTWSVGVDYASDTVRGLRTSVSYFDIVYRNRIGELSNLFTALTDPLDAPFVTRAPSEAAVENLINSAAYFLNLVGTPVNPANVPAIVNDNYVNIASQDLIGADLDIRYHRSLAFGAIEPFLNGVFLDLRQRLVPGVPEEELNGRVFEPAKDRARGGVSWLIQGYAVTGILNYTGSEVNTYQPGLPHVASWTTVDFDLAWHTKESSLMGELALSLSVENAFNRDPPFVQFDQNVPGIHYDPLNADALGRVLRAEASWLFE